MINRGQLTIDGGKLKWSQTNNGPIFYTWHNVLLGHISIEEGQCYALGLDEKPDQKHQFATFEEAHAHMQVYLKTREEKLLDMHRRRQEHDEAVKQEKEEWNAKYHHLELKDVKPDSEIFFSDLISARLSNFMRAAGLTTLKQIAQMKKSEFLKYRNCGKKLADEIEAMFAITGLSWEYADPSVENEALKQFSNEELLAECRRRGILP